MLTKKIGAVVFFMLLLLPSVTLAIPNVWISDFNQGIFTVWITNQAGDRFVINCDVGFSEEGRLTSAHFYLADGADLSPSEEHTVQLLIDGNAYWVPDSLGWRRADNAWLMFLESIKLATQFEVYVNSERKASFSPTPQSAERWLPEPDDECSFRY